MVDVASSLARFEDPNRFEALQLKEEEFVGDVESPEEILKRWIRYASELATPKQTRDDVAYDAKKRNFEEDELEDGWTIVAARRSRRSAMTPVQQTEDIPSVVEEKPKKPRKWRRGLFALGAAAALGLASILLHRRGRRRQ